LETEATFSHASRSSFATDILEFGRVRDDNCSLSDKKDRMLTHEEKEANSLFSANWSRRDNSILFFLLVSL
jgi:hypothetical protein